jgi:hypothetical protein
MKTYSNPFEQGKQDALDGKENSNPYSENDFGKWVQYNTAFNIHNPKTTEYFKRQQQLKKSNNA